MSEPVTSPALNPWWRIWVQPRQAIRYLVDTDPKMHFWVLVIFSGIIQTAVWSMTTSIGDHIPPPSVAAFILIGGSISGTIGIYFTASLLELVGRLLGGKAEGQHLRAVLAWASIPLNVLVVLGFLPLISMFGSDVFTSTNPIMQQLLSPQNQSYYSLGPSLMLWQTLLDLIGSIYYIVIVVVGFSEVEELNLFKSIGAFIIVFGGLLLVVFCLALLSSV
jgi:hypothetical protein